jgi:hypothetical protein
VSRYTPASPAAKQYLTHAWAIRHLAPTSFEHWSLDYARDVYEIIAIYAEHDPNNLVRALTEVGVWDPDTHVQQWEPTWRPERSK